MQGNSSDSIDRASLSKRQRVVKRLKEFGLPGDEKYYLHLFKGDLEKVVGGSRKDQVSEKGNELLSLMRDTFRWHRDEYRERLREFHALDQYRCTATSMEHVCVTKEIFGIATERHYKLIRALQDARRQVGRSPCLDNVLLEELSRL